MRYFAPRQEVPFCGHATIASAIALAERKPADEMIFHTPAGLVSINTEQTKHGLVAELTSVSPRLATPPDDLVAAVLDALHWSADDLDPDYPVLLANAGAEHLIMVTRTTSDWPPWTTTSTHWPRSCRTTSLITCALIWPKSRRRYYARNPFAGAVWSRIRRPAPPRRRSVATCASSA